MKIIIDTRWIRSLKFDGIGNFTFNLILELLNYPEKFILLFNDQEIKNQINEHIKGKNNFSFYFLDCSINSLKNIYLLPKLIKEIKPDYFFAPNYSFHGFLIKKEIYVPVVHDLIPILFKQMYKKANYKFRLFYTNKWLQKIILNKPNKLITVSNSTKKDLINVLNLKSNKIKVIIEGVNPLLHIENNSNKKIGYEYLLFVGRHEEYKNIDTLIEVYDLLSENLKNKYKLIIIGQEKEIITDKLKKLVLDKKLIKSIIFINSINTKELANYYRKAKVLVHLSLYEGFGLPIIEAMSFGIPVIASNKSSLPEIICSSDLLVDPKNKLAIVEKLETILTDHKLYEQLKNLSLNHSKKYSWKNSAKQIMSVLYE